MIKFKKLCALFLIAALLLPMGVSAGYSGLANSVGPSGMENSFSGGVDLSNRKPSLLSAADGARGTLSFSDVAKEAWYYDQIMEMAEKGYLAGYPNGQFQPDGTITCAEFVKIVSMSLNLAPASSGNAHWGAGLLQAALDAGLYDWDEIPPTGETYDHVISRQVAVKIVMNAFAPEATGEYGKWQPYIKDFSSLSGRYYNCVFAAYEIGIVEGDDLGNFNAPSGLSRAEACTLIYKALLLQSGELPPVKPVVPPVVETVSGGVSENGQLRVEGTQLVNQDGDAIVLKGMSTHGMQWFPQYASYGSIKATRDYGANVFRVAMYTNENGYIQNQAVKKSVIEAVDQAIALDMYVIIDWHILSDGNPNTYLAQSKVFFKEMAERYQDAPGVLFEICNEPNGNVTWEKDIRPYAMEVVKQIRAISPNAIVLVGTGTWSQDVHQVSANPLPYDNVMYSLHFYAGTHGDQLRNQAKTALRAGTPIFVTEWGTSRADGGSGVYLDAAQTWIDFLEENGISWVNWSLCDKNESSAALKPGASASGGWTESDLSESGKFVFSKFK